MLNEGENVEKMQWIQWMKERSSVRTFENKEIEEDRLEQLKRALEDANQGLSKKAYFKLIQSNSKSDETQKLGTYGIIQGTRDFIAVITTQDEVDATHLGYQIEKIVLIATGLDLGTCWLGGTFNRSSFENHLALLSNEKLVILIAIGYRKNKQSMIESTMRFIAKSNHRKNSSELFFEGDDKTALDLSSIGEYKRVLEMVRIAPSASNKQPWRVIKELDNYHFYRTRTPGYGWMSYDLQSNDIGIAQCHFELTALELGMDGKWENVKTAPSFSTWEYVESWKCKIK